MKDTWFIRGNIPMTKGEVRAVSLDKLDIRPDSIVYDIGAGTGSVSVEAALQAVQGHVYAFEQKEEGVELIRENGRRAGVSNLTVIPGKAPETMTGLPRPDRVFIGGSGGNLEAVLDRVYEQNPKVQVVINVIALETLARVMAYYEKRGTDPEVVCLQVAKARLRVGYHMMQGANPVYVITAEPEPEQEKDREREADLEVEAGLEVETGLEAEADLEVETGREAESGLKENTDLKQKQDAAAKVSEKGQDPLPRIMLAAPASGSGKTVLTAGLLTAFAERGISCASFKCGPDYIDPMFHQYVLGIPSCNLDSFFLEEDQIRQLLKKQVSGKDLAVLEGVMGYYDGVAGNTLTASSYDIARITRTPVILVLDGKGSSLSMAAVIKGMKEFRPDSWIAGVILNRTSPVMAKRLQEAFEELGIPCLGAVPECEECRLESRHLGLTIPEEQTGLKQQLKKLAAKLENCLDIGQILKIAASETETFGQDGRLKTQEKVLQPVGKRRMAVARDEAFCFYYQENLEFLQDHGWELTWFSPLKDEKLPENTQAVLLGGGYPEVWAKQLSENTSMLASVRQAAKNGVKILAECGGFLYLHRTLEGTDGEKYPMAGLLDGEGYRTKKLSRFGYISLYQDQAGEKKPKIKGHEFHYWDSTLPGTSMTARKPASDRQWECMVVTDTLMAGFPHLYYHSGPQWILDFLEEAQP